MACGFHNLAGYRMNLYVRYESTSGGVEGILNGKTISAAIGLDASPQALIEELISKLEKLFAAKKWKANFVKMTPALRGKTIIDDPVDVAQQTAVLRKSDRAARLAAWMELQKLDLDAPHRSRHSCRDPRRRRPRRSLCRSTPCTSHHQGRFSSRSSRLRLEVRLRDLLRRRPCHHINATPPVAPQLTCPKRQACTREYLAPQHKSL